MAASWQSHRYLGSSEVAHNTATYSEQFEFDESEVWNTRDNISPPGSKKTATNNNMNPIPLRKPGRKNAIGERADCVRSLPVNVPDWSKILRGEYRNNRVGDFSDDYYVSEEDEGNDRLPPHEYLARTRVASMSVHEGAGRTLKGRDMSRVRNAIWKKIGFED